MPSNREDKVFSLACHTAALIAAWCADANTCSVTQTPLAFYPHPW